LATTYERERATADIMDMPIADGLKDLLMNYDLTRNDILTYSIGDLADLLNIDEYVAKLIIDAAKYHMAEIAKTS
jgi:hypothetical protein